MTDPDRPTTTAAMPDTSPRRRDAWWLSVAVVTLGAAALAGCGSSGDGEVSSGETSARLSRGAAVYAASCASCHGTDLRGTDAGPSHLSVVYEPGHHGDDSFRAAIANGSVQHHWNFGDMPPIPGLSDDDVDAVIAYIRDVQEREGFE